MRLRVLGSSAEGGSRLMCEESVCRFDMTAFVKSGTKPRVGIVTDFVSPEMSGTLHRRRNALCRASSVG